MIPSVPGNVSPLHPGVDTTLALVDGQPAPSGSVQYVDDDMPVFDLDGGELLTRKERTVARVRAFLSGIFHCFIGPKDHKGGKVGGPKVGYCRMAKSWIDWRNVADERAQYREMYEAAKAGTAVGDLTATATEIKDTQRARRKNERGVFLVMAMALFVLIKLTDLPVFRFFLVAGVVSWPVAGFLGRDRDRPFVQIVTTLGSSGQVDLGGLRRAMVTAFPKLRPVADTFEIIGPRHIRGIGTEFVARLYEGITVADVFTRRDRIAAVVDTHEPDNVGVYRVEGRPGWVRIVFEDPTADDVDPGSLIHPLLEDEPELLQQAGWI